MRPWVRGDSGGEVVAGPWTPAVSMEIPGFMEPDELQWLHDRARWHETILEVGCWMGRSTSALAAGCAGIVYTVDHFRGSPSELGAAHAEALTRDIREDAVRNLSGYENVRVLTHGSLEASRLFQASSLGMVFIDGDHERESVLIDLISWRPKARKLLCGHDRDWPGVQEALAIYGIPYEQGPGSIWWMEMVT